MTSQSSPSLTTRFWTKPGQTPADVANGLQWERRTARITGDGGRVVFEQHDVEVPKTWSAMATNVVASKYFRGALGTPERETSVRQLVGRVVDTITHWGVEGGYLRGMEEARTFAAELTFLLLTQRGAFNSPVWFNLGVAGTAQQVSACFLTTVGDSLESIQEWYATESRVFKGGSGSGTNLSHIRSSHERLEGGGVASGPMSFARVADANAGAIKSGGKTRRAAKLICLDDDHPDLLEFIRCKAEEERKAWALIEAGWDGGFDAEGGAYKSVSFQNANNSVRVTDAFMQAVVDDGTHNLTARTTGEVVEVVRAREVFREIAQAAHICGDPGLMFHTTQQDWHTVPNSGPIRTANPCIEFQHLDDTSCNLASVNLIHFRRRSGEIDVAALRHASRLLILAQEILVGPADYPTQKIAETTRRFRPLGLGYANLGALLMARGLPYDSDEGRTLAASITALMTGEAYAMSAEMAAAVGPFEAFELNREPMLGVILKHAYAVEERCGASELATAASVAWNRALALGGRHGYRNSQTTCIAPTGTISFLLDCDTTGIEPDLALVKHKTLVGGGSLKIVNQTVPDALQQLGYDARDSAAILAHVDEHSGIEGAPHLKPEHLAVFDCAFRAPGGERSIGAMGHLKMMAAVQPFVSGAISKTVNLPADVTVDQVGQVYMDAWRMGLKAVALYRDGSKRTQPLNSGKKAETRSPDLVAPAFPSLKEFVAGAAFEVVPAKQMATCSGCGRAELVPAGACHRCTNCGATTGCG